MSRQSECCISMSPHAVDSELGGLNVSEMRDALSSDRQERAGYEPQVPLSN